MKQLFLDVETKKIFDQVGGYYPEKLGISFVGAILRSGFPETGQSTETRYELFESNLSQLWPILEAADVIVGYNHINFDLPVLSAYYPGNIQKLPALDLLEIIKTAYGRRISLDAVAQTTLGYHKSGSGLDAIAYYENRQFDLLAQYCMKDVEITRDLYDYGRTRGHFKFLNHWNNLIEVPVNLNFSPATAPTLQLTLV